jgi:hypothetical protein
MPQGPIGVQDRNDATGYVANMTATGGVVAKSGAARLVKVNVIAASTAAGGIYDCAATGSTAAANKIFSVPATIGPYELNWPCTSGVTVFPAAGMTLAITLA